MNSAIYYVHFANLHRSTATSQIYQILRSCELNLELDLGIEILGRA